MPCPYARQLASKVLSCAEMDVTTLSGKVVLITGAASGIGRATALACARRGARLQICDLDETGLEATAEQARQLGEGAITVRGNHRRALGCALRPEPDRRPARRRCEQLAVILEPTAHALSP